LRAGKQIKEKAAEETGNQSNKNGSDHAGWGGCRLKLSKEKDQRERA
jgi:hypothetical protein